LAPKKKISKPLKKDIKNQELPSLDKRDEEKKSSIKVVLVDDHPIVRRGIREVLENSGTIAVSGEAASSDEAIKIINKVKPDVAVVDIIISGCSNGIDLIKSISERMPSVKCLVLSMHDESMYAERAIRAGARGYIMKDIAPKNIIEAIQTVMKGDLYLKDETMKILVDKLLTRSNVPTETTTDILSDREFEVFRLLGNGFSVREISKKLNVSVHTVECHRRNIKKKLKVRYSADLLKYAIQWVISSGR
jgi:DNA-binding NarL/FixJ family response regulator